MFFDLLARPSVIVASMNFKHRILRVDPSSTDYSQAGQAPQAR